MDEYIFFMYDDVVDLKAANDDAAWDRYVGSLQASGQFDGGSSIGAGSRFKKNHPEQPVPADCTGYIRVRADNMQAAQAFLAGNPIYEAGGTVEIRLLPRN